MKRYGIGRDAANDIVVDHPSVSRYHAELVETAPGTYSIVDLGSKYGTRVDRGGLWIEISDSDVSRGHRVRLGNYVRSVDWLLDAARIRSPELQKSHRAQTSVVASRRAPEPNMALAATLLGIGILCGGVFVLFH